MESGDDDDDEDGSCIPPDLLRITYVTVSMTIHIICIHTFLVAHREFNRRRLLRMAVRRNMTKSKPSLPSQSHLQSNAQLCSPYVHRRTLSLLVSTFVSLW